VEAKIQELHVLDRSQNSRLLQLLKVEGWVVAVTVFGSVFE